MSEYKLIVAGGRDFKDYDTLYEQIMYLATESTLADFDVSIVSGAARGADELAIRFARLNNVKCYTLPAEWDKYGKGAGFKRNLDMANFADGLLAFWDGKSNGTRHMIDTMKRMNKLVTIVHY